MEYLIRIKRVTVISNKIGGTLSEILYRCLCITLLTVAIIFTILIEHVPSAFNLTQLD